MKSVAILTGPTASGKTAIALAFARAHSAIEIINADSLLVYRGMDIGTAKPSAEELAICPHHLIDIHEPSDPFTAGDFTRLAEKAIETIHARGKRALIVGGSGFYLKALLHGLWETPKADPELRVRLERENLAHHVKRLTALDPESAARIGPTDRYRIIRAIEMIELSGLTPTELRAQQEAKPRRADLHLLVIDRATTELESRIEKRTDGMLGAGLVEETEALVRLYGESARPLAAVGYAETVRYLKQEKPAGRKIAPGVEGLRDEIRLATRQLVKRQRTWFKAQPGAENYILERDAQPLQARLLSLYGEG